MSKRDMRAKRLLLAVLLAMSVQSYHAVPTWAEESGQTVKQAVKVDGEENAGTITVPADSESEAAAATDVDQEESAAAAAPAVTYSSRTAGSGTYDYGVMPLADQAINGALTGVTTINGANFKVGTAGSGSDSIAIGVGAELVYENSMGRIGENATVIGNKAAAPTHGTAIGYSARLNEYAIGSIAIGSMSEVTNSDSIAIGCEANVSNRNGIAIGSEANVSNENSIAIGYRSTTNADNQVSFGTMGDTSTYRDLAGIKNIDMAGALTGVTAINGITIDSSRNIANAGTYNGATITSTSFNGMSIGDGKIENMSIRGNAIFDLNAIRGVKDINGVRFELDSSNAGGSIFIGKNVSGELTQKASIAIGGMAYAVEDYSIAFGGNAGAEAKYGIAIGLNANAKHENSIAIGYNSETRAANQVSFGKSGAYRSLTGISDIAMNGALTGVTTINTANFQVVGGSLAIGQSSETVNGSYYSLAIGNTALVIGGESNIAVGHSAKVAGGNLNIVVGSDAKVTGGGNNVVVGSMAEVTQDKNSSIAIGDRATAGGSSGVAIGSGSKVNDSEAIAIGSDTEAGYALWLLGVVLRQLVT